VPQAGFASQGGGQACGVDAGRTTVLDATPEALAPARHATVEAFVAAGGDRSESDSVALAVTEACANAVRHAYPSGHGQILLDTWVEDELFVVQVRDRGVLLDAETRVARDGLGVQLMREVAEADVVPRMSGGTEVRLAFPLT
jgi:anti-sigma regulatory factor (Ser/Thr protein kinase)